MDKLANWLNILNPRTRELRHRILTGCRPSWKPAAPLQDACHTSDAEGHGNGGNEQHSPEACRWSLRQSLAVQCSTSRDDKTSSDPAEDRRCRPCSIHMVSGRLHHHPHLRRHRDRPVCLSEPSVGILPFRPPEPPLAVVAIVTKLSRTYLFKI